MKQSILLLFITFSFADMYAQDIQFALYNGEKAASESLKTAEEKEGAKLKQTGTATTWAYGTIEKATTGVRFFKFNNTGQAPLVISNAKGSCGCTVPSYPKEPIMPGESGFIKVKYDTKRVNPIRKTITVTSNADRPTVALKIKGTVIDSSKASVIEDKDKSVIEQ